jgi:hypothetical protein
MVEAAGVEPASGTDQSGTSPCATRPLTVSVRATHSIGTVAISTATATRVDPSMSCGGDACGCSLWLSLNPDSAVHSR